MEQQKDNIVEKFYSEESKQRVSFTSKRTLSESDSPTILETDSLIKPSFSDKWQTNRFLIVRGSYYIVRTVWMTVMVIGGFIAWLISLLFI